MENKSIGGQVAGLGICAAACLGASAADMPALFSMGAALAAHIGAEVVSKIGAWAVQRSHPREPTGKQGDPCDVAIAAIDKVLSEVIAKQPGGSDGVQLLKDYKAQVPSLLFQASIDKQYQGIWDAAIPQYFKAAGGSIIGLKVLTPEIWRYFLQPDYDELVKHKRLKQPQLEALNAATAALCDELPARLAEAYGDAFNDHSKLRFEVQAEVLKEIWNQVSGIAKKQNEHTEVLGVIRGLVEDLAITHRAEMQAYVQAFAGTAGDFDKVLARIASSLEKTHAGVSRIETDVAELRRDVKDVKASLEQGYAEQASEPYLRDTYLNWVSGQASALPLFAGDTGEQVRLSSVYTALLTDARDTENVLSHAGREQYMVGGREREQLTALEMLDRERQLVLMGGPGSGKSTFLNFVALCMAGELQNDPEINLALLCQRLPVTDDEDRDKVSRPPQWTRDALLPVRVLLRDFAAAAEDECVTADTLWQFIVNQLPDPIKRYAGALQAELLGVGGLILLDGLDEVPDALQKREHVKKAVQEFAGIYRRCRFLVTSRTYAYQNQAWKLDDFAAHELLPFTRGQIEQFIKTWYDHMEQLHRLTRLEADGCIEILKRETRRLELLELAKRPLLLTLMAQLQTKARGPLPPNREKLYAESVNMLLEAWEGLKIRRNKQGKAEVIEPSLSEWLNSSHENIRRELEKLAYHAHRNQPTLTGTADIRESEIIAALVAASRDRPDARLLRLTEYLRDRAGLLSSHGVGMYQFPHRTFQEYLASCYLVREEFPEMIGQPSRRWRELASRKGFLRMADRTVAGCLAGGLAGGLALGGGVGKGHARRHSDAHRSDLRNCEECFGHALPLAR